MSFISIIFFLSVFLVPFTMIYRLSRKYSYDKSIGSALGNGIFLTTFFFSGFIQIFLLTAFETQEIKREIILEIENPEYVFIDNTSIFPPNEKAVVIITWKNEEIYLSEYTLISWGERSLYQKIEIQQENVLKPIWKWLERGPKIGTLVNKPEIEYEDYLYIKKGI